jgi:hypothetical protein
MKLTDVVPAIANFDGWNHPQKILFFGWFLHYHQACERFSQSDIRLCYDSLNVQKPSNIGAYFVSLERSNPKRLLRDRGGFYLPKQLREEFDKSYGERATMVQVHDLLAKLPSHISNTTERVFLEETLVCFRHKAFRAAIVMCWNLAFDHLRSYMLSYHLPAFNAQFPKVSPKKRLPAGVARVEDFDEFKESEVLEICRGANIINGNVFKILDEKLARRNIAAHPSTVVITQLQAEDFISDLVNNVVLRL